jgi:hypothetical protein
MKIAYFDCFHGAAGDMLLAGLLDAGLELTALEQVLAALPLSGYTIEQQRVVSHHVTGRRVRVRIEHAQPARTWENIRTLLETNQLPTRTRTWALGAFRRLARVEAAIHGVAVEDVHFHEVGAVDSIVDLVGVCAGLELLGVEQVYASALPTGRGWVATQHGRLPVPAPATLALLAEVGAPVVPGISPGELLTPSAAALLAELAHFTQPAMQIERVGYGLGQKEFDQLNGLRVWLGTSTGDGGWGDRTGSKPTNAAHLHNHSHTHSHDQQSHGHVHSHNDQHAQHPETHQAVVELRCNLDDATGELVAYVIEQLLAAGGLDAWAAPLVMKKGRPGTQLACLARPADVAALSELMLRETPTLGVRWEQMERRAVDRHTLQVTTPWGPVRLKQKLLGGAVIAGAPEYEDCAALARAHQVPLAQVFAAALGHTLMPTAAERHQAEG